MVVFVVIVSVVFVCVVFSHVVVVFDVAPIPNVKNTVFNKKCTFNTISKYYNKMSTAPPNIACTNKLSSVLLVLKFKEKVLQLEFSIQHCCRMQGGGGAGRGGGGG